MKRICIKLAAALAAVLILVPHLAIPVCAAADPAVVTTNAVAGWPQAEDINSTTGILIDAATGTVLFNKSMDQQMYPASITKILTTLVVLENGNMADPVTMTETGVAYAVGGSANQGTQVGEVFTLEQLVYGTMLASANDMSTQMGEYIGGSIENFAAMMNARAAELGCTGTRFTNACGMPDPNHVTTAHDMALIMRAAVERSDFRSVIGTSVYTIPATNMRGERTITNHDPLLTNPDFQYAGLLGGKTGYTDSALSTLVNAASRDGFTLICVTMHAVDAPRAAMDNVQLLNYGFDHFEMCEVLPAEYCEGGRNRIVVPKGVQLTDCQESVEEYSADGKEMVRQTYSYGGYSLGSVTLTKENKEAYEKALADAAKAAEEAAKAAEKEALKEKEKAEEADGKDAGKDIGSGTESGPAQGHHAMSEAEKTAEQQVRMIRLMFGVVGIGVGLLFLIFIILLIRYIIRSRK